MDGADLHRNGCAEKTMGHKLDSLKLCSNWRKRRRTHKTIAYKWVCRCSSQVVFLGLRNNWLQLEICWENTFSAVLIGAALHHFPDALLDFSASLKSKLSEALTKWYTSLRIFLSFDWTSLFICWVVLSTGAAAGRWRKRKSWRLFWEHLSFESWRCWVVFISCCCWSLEEKTKLATVLSVFLRACCFCCPETLRYCHQQLTRREK